MTSSLEGAANFRDLGGHTAQGGRTVRIGRIFRSDHLGALTAGDASRISQWRLRRILDLRGTAERVSALPTLDGVTVHSLPIEPTVVQKLTDLLAAGHTLAPADVVALMQDTYRGFVRNSTHRFAALFVHLLESNEPMVFHCTAGKDRTGFAAALILLGLGVSRDDVMRDYLLSNERLMVEPASRQGLAPEIVSVLYRVQPDFLDAAFEAVEQDFGSIEAYLHEGLGLGLAERERLRELYLEPDGEKVRWAFAMSGRSGSFR